MKEDDQVKRASLPEKAHVLSPEALDFTPSLLAIQESPPARLPRVIMYSVSALFMILLLWSFLGKLDIIASAEGRLVPQTYVKIVQPAEGGIVQDLLVKEGEHVVAGQVLARMNATDAKADENTLQTQLALRALQLRRIDAELGNGPFEKKSSDPDDLYRQVEAQYRDHRKGYADTLDQAQQVHTRSGHDIASAQEVLAKLREVVPILKQQADNYTELGTEGYVSQGQMRDKQREYLEKSRDLRAQEANIASLNAAKAAAGKQVEQITSKYRSDLQNERIDAEAQYRKLQQDWAKQERKSGLLELKAPQGGIVKELATHTTGAVVAPGTILLSLVPDNEPLVAEVMVRNDDVGFIYPNQKVKLKLAAYPFQQYGMLDGKVLNISADASDVDSSPAAALKDGNAKSKAGSLSAYKVLISLEKQQLDTSHEKHKLVPGMQVIAEINEGQRTVLEYLLSPIQKAVRESGRER